MIDNLHMLAMVIGDNLKQMSHLPFLVSQKTELSQSIWVLISIQKPFILEMQNQQQKGNWNLITTEL